MATLSAVGQIVRRHDPDRFLTALFAPADRRETLFALYAFNHELARAREAAREPMAALIRLQWWREVVEGKRVRHEVAGPLGAALDAGRLEAGLLAGMVDAREAETESVPDMAAFEAYVRGTAGGLMVAAAAALGDGGAERLRDAGAGFGIVGVVRSAPVLARAGRSVLPGVGAAEVLGGAWEGVRAGLLERASAWLASPGPVRGKAVPAALPLVLARRRCRRGADRPVGDRVAVVVAGFSGRV